MKIVYSKKPEAKKPKIGVGDFIMVTDDNGREDLVVIVQHDSGRATAFSVLENDISRKNGVSVDLTLAGGDYEDLSDFAISRMLEGRPYRKVNATLTISECQD